MICRFVDLGGTYYLMRSIVASASVYSRNIVFTLAVSIASSACALSPVDPDSFFKKVSQSPNVECGVWSGRGDLCMKKAKETGYLMLWFLYYSEDGLHVKRFLQNDLCKQVFCDLINNYKYIILCCENAGHQDVYNRKNTIYGYSANSKIYNEATGTEEHNHNGFPVYSRSHDSYCFYTPSLHLLKFDSGSTVIFHISPSNISGSDMIYEPAFSPYASRIPISSGMCIGSNANNRFAPWLKQYLDMYPVAEQIEEYEERGSTVTPSPSGGGGIITNYTYQTVEIAVTETINPTAYQIALHRDNLLFRAVTMMRDILVKRRVDDVFSRFDDHLSARNFTGKWFVNYDDTLSAMLSEITSVAEMDVVPDTNCTLVVNQCLGSGFTFSGYEWTASTNIFSDTAVSEAGIEIQTVVTNIEVTVESSPFITTNVSRNCLTEFPVYSGKLYGISVDGNSTFDVFSTK